ncbi:MAG: NYN domain-containing protein [Candidatus Omnitrophica bacterium]|nr:NYN domain-containing protein [Candidatus Omnitrophota bacterium]MDD5081543.1 NYN domain-containing protein [Candidatus Omnitrophota bacterium]
MNRMIIFIDAEYVVQKIKDSSESRKRVNRKDINWKNIIKWIVGRRKLIRCYYYSAAFNKSENEQTYKEQNEYFKQLKLTIPYFDIKLGRLVRVNGGWVQKGLDVRIAVDMFDKAVMNHYDIAALITGDSDFAEVISVVKERFGKHVELYTFDKSIHEALRLVPDKHTVLDSALGKKYNFWNK